MTELKPCPFCGSSNVSLHRFTTTRWTVVCVDCPTSSGCVRGREDTIAAWNRRAEPTQQPGPDRGPVHWEGRWYQKPGDDLWSCSEHDYRAGKWHLCATLMQEGCRLCFEEATTALDGLRALSEPPAETDADRE